VAIKIHGMRTTLQQKKEILEMAQAGKSSPEIASALNLGVRVVRKWRQLGKKRSTP
jgi:DNA-binding NarL/FixJ family response regulator